MYTNSRNAGSLIKIQSAKSMHWVDIVSNWKVFQRMDKFFKIKVHSLR